MKYLVILSIILSSCGILERHNDNFIITTKQNQSVYSTDDALEDDKRLNVISNFTKDLEPYIDDLLRELYTVNDDGIRRCEFFSETQDFLDHLEVMLDGESKGYARAYWSAPRLIVIHVEDKMESLYGHELVRYILYMCGHQDEAFELSNGGWTGLRGEMWNIAETESLKYLEVLNVQ